MKLFFKDILPAVLVLYLCNIMGKKLVFLFDFISQLPGTGKVD